MQRCGTLVLCACLLPGLLSSCSEPRPPGGIDPASGAGTIGELQQALGEPQNGFPSWEERLVLVQTNRVRCDPVAEIAAICPTSCTGTYSPVKPLALNYDMSRAARFQGTSLRKANAGLMHESICTLVSNLGSIYPSTCDGSASCACVGGTATCTCPGYNACPTGGCCTCASGCTGTF